MMMLLLFVSFVILYVYMTIAYVILFSQSNNVTVSNKANVLP